MPPRRVQQIANQGSNNDVRGPTSALTSFLREQGITGNIQRRPSPAVTPPAPALPATAEESDEESSVNAIASTSAGPSTVAIEVSASSSGGKRKKGGQAASAAAKKKKKKTAGSDDDSDGGDGLFDVPGKKAIAKPGRYDSRMPGAISVCGECGKKFTVTKYTASNPLGAGLLCMPCSNESLESMGNTAAAHKPKAPKKRAVKMIDEKAFKPVKTLQQFCITVIGKHIDNVVGLGDIGPKNRDRIAKIVSKNRALTSANLDLFLDVGHTELALYDCTNIAGEDLASIGKFCPHLERLTLNMCGQMDDSVLEAWRKDLKELKYLSLHAPYLVTPTAWTKFFEHLKGDRALEGLGIRQSARLDNAGIATLIANCPDIYNLQLSEIGKMTDLSLPILHPLKNLTSLDISRAGVPEGTTLTDDAVVELLEHVGEKLVELVLDQNLNLTDRVLIEGVKIHCPTLRSLSLHSLHQIQSTGLQDLFTNWVNPGLTRLILQRCILIENEAMEAVLVHSGASLQFLDLNSVDNLEEPVLYALAEQCSQVEWLDVSFVRAMDNFVVKAFLDKMDALKVLFVHGNNRISYVDCPQKKGVSIRGQENYMHVEL